MKNSDRLRKLKASIQFFYGELDFEDIDLHSSHYEQVTTDMFQVVEVQKNSVTLMHLFNDELYGPLLLPVTFTSLLKVKDVFLITMGVQNEAWHAIYISPPYDNPGA